VSGVLGVLGPWLKTEDSQKNEDGFGSFIPLISINMTTTFLGHGVFQTTRENLG
jgi:hypothetical protein